MGKKKRTKKELESQLQLTAIFEGIFDSQLIAGVLKEARGDHEIAVTRLTDMMNSMYESGTHTSEGPMTSFDSRLGPSHEESIDQICSIFPLDRDVVSAMLIECDHSVERVIQALSAGECEPLSPQAHSRADEIDLTDIDTPIEVMKYMLADFMSPQSADQFLQDKQCTRDSSIEHLHGVMNDILMFISADTTTAQTDPDGHVMINDSHESATVDLYFYDSALYFQDEMTSGDKSDLAVARDVVRGFFNSSGSRGQGSVTDSTIDTALELSRGTNQSQCAYDPDAAIGWICEELSAEQQQMTVFSVPTAAQSSRLVLKTYAGMASRVPEEARPVACSFGGDSEKSANSNSQNILSNARTRTQAQTQTVDTSASGMKDGSSHSDLASYWRSKHEEHKKSMLQYFSASTLTRSRDTLAAAQHLKQSMYHAAAESAKFALLSHNPHVLVGNSGGFVEFLGFTRRSPKKDLSIDMHGTDVRSAVQFVKSLVDACCRTGDRVNVSLIVGVGNNSIRNIPRLKPAVTQYLRGCSAVKLQSCGDGTVCFSMGK